MAELVDARDLKSRPKFGYKFKSYYEQKRWLSG